MTSGPTRSVRGEQKSAMVRANTPVRNPGTRARTHGILNNRFLGSIATAETFELVFILSAGQDESSTWQEFGEMKFACKEAVPDAFGPAPVSGSDETELPNWSSTRYVEWTSWASAATIWPNAGAGSSTQAESSGMGVYAHELSHLLGIADNCESLVCPSSSEGCSRPHCQQVVSHGSY